MTLRVVEWVVATGESRPGASFRPFAASFAASAW